jgi:hypothetical protein
MIDEKEKYNLDIKDKTSIISELIKDNTNLKLRL